MQTDLSQIAAYYDYTVPFYQYFWHGSTNAVHYGFSDAGTATFDDQLLNTNCFLAEVARICRGEQVLDSGCGIGGSAFWLARNIGAEIIGITVSGRQVHRARSLAARYGLADRTRFLLRNFLDNGFCASSFDVVWAIESACYLGHSAEFVQEAHRLLRPGGRLVVADGFLLRPPATFEESRWLVAFTEGLVLPGLTPVGLFAERLARYGFEDVRCWDKTTAIRPSAERLYRRCRAGYLIARLGEQLRLTPPLLTKNNLAGVTQLRLIDSGIAGYAVFCATKPDAR